MNIGLIKAGQMIFEDINLNRLLLEKSRRQMILSKILKFNSLFLTFLSPLSLSLSLSLSILSCSLSLFLYLSLSLSFFHSLSLSLFFFTFSVYLPWFVRLKSLLNNCDNHHISSNNIFL